jgi:hypothetical protein
MNLYGINESNDVDGRDAIKISSVAGGVTLSLLRDGKDLVIERRQLINKEDTIFFTTRGLSRTNYQFEFIADNISQDVKTGFLEDSYLKTKTPVNLNGTTTVNFTVNTDPLSAAKDRFRIVFEGTSKDVVFTKLEATPKNNDIVVDWSVTNEVNMKSYELETSSNGQQFVKAATFDPKGNDYSSEQYQWVDANVKPGVYYYRIRATRVTGEVQYSNVVKIVLTRGRADIKVYPNPVVNGIINIQMINQPEGNYTFKLINGLGQVILNRQVNYHDGDNLITFKVSSNMVDESYRLEVTKPDRTTVSMNVLLQ